MPDAQLGGLSHRQIMTALSGLMVGMFIAAIDQTIVATALPKIVTDLGGIQYLSWVIVGYLLTSMASTPLWGKIGDLYGRRRMFQTAVVVFLVGSLACGAAPSMLALVLARLLQGVGGGGLYALCFAIVGDLVPPRQRGRYVSYFAAMFAVAGVIGPLVGGVLTDHLGWRWIFTVNLPIGGASLVITSVALKVPNVRREAQVDLLGALLLVTGVVFLVLITVWGGDKFAWGSVPIATLAAAGVVLLALFIVWERRAPEPILPLRLLHNRVLTTILGLAFFLGPVYYVSGSFIPLFLQGVHGYSATNSGLMLAPSAAGLSVAAIITGRLTTRNGRYKHWVIIGAILLSADLVVLSRITASWNIWWVAFLMVMVGVGLGCALPVLNTAGQNAVEAHDLGVATSSVTFFRTLGGSFGVAVLGAVLKGRLDHLLAGMAASTPLPKGMSAKGLADHPSDIAGLVQPLRGLVGAALAHSVASVFLAAVPLALVALVLGWRLEERPLRETTFATPAAPEQTGTSPAVDVAAAPAAVD